MADEPTSLFNDDDPLLTRSSLARELRSLGVPISDSTLEKLCMLGEGPPVDWYWGKRPLTRRSNARRWAEQRLASTPPKRQVVNAAGGR